MDPKDAYRRFIDWPNQTWWRLPPAPELLPLILQIKEKIEDPPLDPRDYLKRFFTAGKQKGPSFDFGLHIPSRFLEGMIGVKIEEDIGKYTRETGTDMVGGSEEPFKKQSSLK